MFITSIFFGSERFQTISRRTQDPNKHLRWKTLQLYLMAVSCWPMLFVLDVSGDPDYVSAFIILKLLWRRFLSYRHHSFIFSVNQWTGFCMQGVSVMKELRGTFIIINIFINKMNLLWGIYRSSINTLQKTDMHHGRMLFIFYMKTMLVSFFITILKSLRFSRHLILSDLRSQIWEPIDLVVIVQLKTVFTEGILKNDLCLST